MTNFARGTLTASSNNGGQLDTIAAASQTISFGLDALGNTTSKVSNGSTLSRTFNAQNQEASNSASTSALYDHDGNEVKNEGRGTIYAYDAWNRLSTVVTSGGTALAGYNYDALGRRNEWYPFIAFAGGTLNVFSYYSAAGQVLEDRWATSTPLAPSAIFQNVWSEAYVNAMVLRDQDYTNNTLYQRLYAQQDANWNTTAVTDTAGTVQERFAYDPYGNMTVLNAGGTVTGGGSTTGWRYFFQGGRLDFATGWYLFGARDYNPGEGRWAERDPLGQAADLNVYRFTGNNPVGMVDPSGLFGDKSWYQSDESWYPLGYLNPANWWGANYIARGISAVPQEATDGALLMPRVAVQSDMTGHSSANFAQSDIMSPANDTQHGGKGYSSLIAFPGGDPSSPEINQGMQAAAKYGGAMSTPIRPGISLAATTRAQNVAKGIPESQLGPSGEPIINVVNHSSRKRAKDAARAGGKGAPIHNPNDVGQLPHYHAVDKNGKKLGKQSPHYTYPDSQK